MNYAPVSDGPRASRNIAEGVTASEAVIAFDFRGAGNFGADLMMDGFLRAVKHFGFDYEGRLVENATVVNHELLEAQREMALEGVLACKFW